MNILDFFQPPATEFNIWHVLISLMSLIFQFDIENQQRYFVNGTTVEVSAWTLIWSSGPSEMIGLLTAALLSLGRIRYMAIPFISNATMLTGSFGLHSYGSAFGLAAKTIQVFFCQEILYFYACEFPTFFEDCFSSMSSRNRRTLNDVVTSFIESNPLLSTSDVANYKILEETTLNWDGYDKVHHFWKLLHPSDENFTFWLLLVGFFLLLLHHNVENSQRMDIHITEESNSTLVVALYNSVTSFYQKNSTEQMEYIRVLIESPPSAFTSFISGAFLAIPRIYLVATNPIVSNLSVLSHIGSMQAVGSGFGIDSTTVFIGLGYDWKVSGLVNGVAYLFAPVFTSFLVNYIPWCTRLWWRGGVTTLIQFFLYFCYIRSPTFFEDNIRKIWPSAPWNATRRTLQRIRSSSLHRSSSRVFNAFAHTTPTPLETIGKVVEQMLGSDSKVENCVVSATVNLTAEGKKIGRHGSPIHHLLRTFSETCQDTGNFNVLKRDLLEGAVESDIKTEVIDQCIHKRYLRVKRRDNVQLLEASRARSDAYGRDRTNHRGKLQPTSQG
ncbi:hypothetical protein GCK72_011029 [Caenorhabditis remanei]|uniref:Uncharacterized protein n=1 Tax=Caenorhabditis remanei TaxID=31234 RepID=A0A6A5H7C7_CAERE|nr:hypothetical protein GCK72_011029 [Caenorhabditis remanei]KAF1762766.1 hypothetical protein GCK72_011029 [Caenorhabditis remanei]